MGDLPIEEDVAFQRREWRMERAGWAGLGVFVVAAAAGAFGDGPLSRASASDRGGQLNIQYERFVRASASSELRLRVSPSAATNGEVSVWAEQAYLRDIEISSVTPQPVRVQQHGERISYAFSFTDAGEPAEIAFRYKPQRAGRLFGRFGVADGGPVEVRQFAFF